MGSPVSPIVANIFMQDLETKAVQYSEFIPKIWYRYVDDTFVIIEKQHEDYFFEHINLINPSIQFTKELESDHKLPFLDVLIHRDISSTLNTTLYRKPTHTNQYLNFESNHPLSTRIGVARTLFDRASQIVKDRDQLHLEQKHIKTTLKKCGYKGWALNQSIRPTLFDIPKNQNKSLRGYVSVPYVQGISESFKRLLTSSTDCSVAFKGSNTIRDHLVHPKDQDEIGSKTNVIYKICCKECSSIYIGQTKRRLKDRIKEHKDIKSVVAGVGVSGVANHVLNTSHIDWDNVTILDGESNKLAREIKESIWIRKCNPELNRKGGFELSDIYSTILQDGCQQDPTEGAPDGNPERGFPSLRLS